MQLLVGWAHGPTLRSGVAQRPLLGHRPNLQFTTKFLNLMAVTTILSKYDSTNLNHPRTTVAFGT